MKTLNDFKGTKENYTVSHGTFILTDDERKRIITQVHGDLDLSTEDRLAQAEADTKLFSKSKDMVRELISARNELLGLRDVFKSQNVHILANQCDIRAKAIEALLDETL